ncbi:MAG: T9SS type A sorting domain-containing protein, partial [Bacteroidia bacterium]|nr:T9SS type A sorting domain-containing protein [Bacteroidia bacterium]
IKNYLGQLVYASAFTSQINLSNLSAGMYFLTVEEKDIKKIVKLIKN